MTDFSQPKAPTDLAPAQPPSEVGVIDALGMGWRLMMADFWPLFVVALVFMLVSIASGFVPFGQFIAGPPLAAGFMWVIAGRIDGRAARVGDLFEGFRQRFGESIMAVLPLLVSWVAYGIIYMGVYFAVLFPIIMTQNHSEEGPEAFLMIFLPFWAIMMALILALTVFQLFFVFAPLAVWEHPKAGWEAGKASMRLVRQRFWQVLGLGVLAWLISFAASLLGMLLLCVGLFFTMPVFMVWMGATLVYLYRSWTGRPLVTGPGEIAAPLA